MRSLCLLEGRFVFFRMLLTHTKGFACTRQGDVLFCVFQKFNSFSTKTTFSGYLTLVLTYIRMFSDAMEKHTQIFKTIHNF